jgi:hypothetical protein
MPFTLYVALGDSMSTDHYPTCDVRGLDVPPVRLYPLGAAALLRRNDDGRWPEFRGLDLETLSPDLDFLGLAEDGAMIDDVATEELARIGRDSSDPDILLTVTTGGNDPKLLRSTLDRIRALVEADGGCLLADATAEVRAWPDPAPWQEE